MTAKTDNAVTQETMRRRTEEKRAKRVAQVPADHDPLARWLPIPGYEGRYELNQLGEIRGLFSGHGKWPGTSIRHQRNPKGYAQVSLHAADGTRKTHRVHRLVALVFLGPPPDGYQTNHKDGNKLNPSLGNLEYVTDTENKRHAVENGLLLPQLGESHGQAKLTDGAVRYIRTSVESNAVLGKRFRVDPQTIDKARRGETWGHVSTEPFQTWLGTGQALLARLQESFGELWLANDVLGVGPKSLPGERFLEVGKIIRAAQEHFERMPNGRD